MPPDKPWTGLYTWLERRITPGLKYSQDFYQTAIEEVVRPDARWLDMGCGHQMLPPWKAEQQARLIKSCPGCFGLDLDFSALRQHPDIVMKTCGDILHLPFAAESFDLVTANMVVEHLEKPEVEFAEVARVLKPGGRFLLHTPNARGYATQLARRIPTAWKQRAAAWFDGRKEADVYPAYYRANTAEKLHAIAAENGLTVEFIRYRATNALLQSIVPLALLELLWIRALLTDARKGLRTNLIVLLRKGHG